MLLSMMAVKKLTYGHSTMNCWHCNTKLIWGGDVDIDEDSFMYDEYLIETNLHCPECNSFFLVYYPNNKGDLYDTSTMA